jgi:hypothetical protein
VNRNAERGMRNAEQEQSSASPDGSAVPRSPFRDPRFYGFQDRKAAVTEAECDVCGKPARFWDGHRCLCAEHRNGELETRNAEQIRDALQRNQISQPRMDANGR